MFFDNFKDRAERNMYTGALEIIIISYLLGCQFFVYHIDSYNHYNLTDS